MSVRYNRKSYSVDEFLSTGPLANDLRRLPRMNLRLGPLGRGNPMLNPPPRFNLGGSRLRLNSPDLSVPGLNLRPSLPTQPVTPFSVPALPSFDPSVIDWLPIRTELFGRGYPFDDRTGDSIVALWRRNYAFLNQTVGLSPEKATLWTNITISTAVGASVNRDYPSLLEKMDRELNTSTTIIPVSDILGFLLGLDTTF